MSDKEKNEAVESRLVSEEELDHTASLPTWTDSGKRKWIYPKRLPGKESKKRFKLSIFLFAFYVIVPWIEVNGIPALRFDIIHNQISVGFSVFRFTDIKYLVFVFGIVGIGLFFITSLRGRIWCGDYCPQTVFLEWLIRPIEEFIEGSAEKRRVTDSRPMTKAVGAKKILKHVLFFAIASALSHAFLGFFVSPYELLGWIQHSPSEHMTAFLITLGITLAFYFDFAYMREQFCTFLCPYARFQAIMIDGDTPSIGYDELRGEPRSKRKSPNKGDCIDCGLCVRVCPTGIDIRNGNQLECIQCRRCEDACNGVMQSLKRPLGLIRMDTENKFKKIARKGLRYRPIIYGTILVIFLAGLITALSVRSTLGLHVTRHEGPPYAELPTGEYTNTFRFTFQNNSPSDVPLKLELGGVKQGKIICGPCAGHVKSLESIRIPVIVVLPKSEKVDKITIKHPASEREIELPFIRPYH